MTAWTWTGPAATVPNSAAAVATDKHNIPQRARALNRAYPLLAGLRWGAGVCGTKLNLAPKGLREARVAVLLVTV